MKMTHKKERSFVFLEDSGKRWKYSKVFFSLALLITITFLFFIVKGLVDKPILTSFDIKHGSIEPINNPVSNSVLSDGKEFSFDSIAVTGEETKPKVFTFYQLNHFSNKENQLSLTENIATTDVLVPDWFYMDKEGHLVEKSDEKIDSLAKDNGVQIVPSVTLDKGITADDFHHLLSNADTKKQMIHNLLLTVKGEGYQGVHLNFDEIHWEDKDLYNQFVTELYSVFKESDLLLSVFARLGDETYDTKVLSEVADHVAVSVFDQHIEQSEPGPLASLQWTEEMLKQYNGDIEKLVPMFANYAYDWNVTSGEPATSYDFTSLMALVNREELKINWDDQSLNPYVRYKDKNEEHIIWLLDGSTFYNQLKVAQSHDIPSIGIWNVGSEDPAIWDLLEGNTADPLVLETIPNRTSIATAGSGDFLKVTQVEKEGERNLVVDNHLIKKATYEKYPSPYLLEKYGVEDKKVSITFDDGPDPKYTEAILDVLDQYDVKAAFFLLGQNASMHPNLTKKIYDEGHEIGSHTFTHKDITKLSDTELAFELNSTQRVIQGITGHSVVMFRPPYLSINERPGDLPTKEVLDRFLKIQDLGYTVVSSAIDPQDWSGKTADEIVQDTISRVQNGHTILLHDAGGDRSETIKALPKIIEWLRENGYAIVPASELIEVERNALMPKVEATEKSMVPLYFYGSSFNATMVQSTKIFLTLLIAVGLSRLALLVFFSFKQKRKSEQLIFDESASPFVTVLIAAYNEEEVIGNTIQSILKNSYTNFELIIVDDGSKDQTAAIVEAEAHKHPNIRLIRKKNGGKASALNLGIKESAAEIIVTLDADTLIAEETISLMVRHFADPTVGAVSGNVKIGNRNNLLTWWQHIEYVTGYNLEKRAFDELDSITVVPGAIGAWRTRALNAVDLFEEDTLAEDTDVTMKLLRKGYKIRSEVNAIAYTEAPEDLRSFIKQRYRWTFGILQCIWKHKKALFSMKHKKLGFIAMPNMIFQYVLLASAPLADYIFLLALLSGNLFVIYFYLVFLVVDSLVSVYAFSLEKESKRPLLSLFVQRMVYRQFFTFVVWKSFINAIKGQLQGWNKLKRTGNVSQAEVEEIEEPHKTVG